MSSIRLFVVAALFAGAGCTENVHATVACNATPEVSMKCEVHEDVGKADIEVCWDLSITCANGEIVGAPRSCKHVEDGGTSELIIPKDKLTNVDKCGGDAPPKMALTKMTINGKSPE